MRLTFLFIIIYAIVLPNLLASSIPVINCPPDITAEAQIGTCTAIVDFIVTSDNTCPDELIFQIAGNGSGGSFPVGITTNTFVVVDGFGSTDTCSFTVEVFDVTPPFILCPTNLAFPTDDGQCSAVVDFEVNTLINCGTDSIYQIQGLASGSVFPIGYTLNEFVAVDKNGFRDSCRFDVLIEDKEPPVANCPQDITTTVDPNSCLAIVNFFVTPFEDNCGVDTVFQVAGLASGSAFPTGTTVCSFEAFDFAGNSSICSFSIIVEDGSNPGFLSCPEDITVGTSTDSCGAFVNYEIPEVSGLCNEIEYGLRQNLSNAVDGSYGCGLNKESRHMRVFDLAGMGVVGDFHIETVLIGIGFADTNDQQIDLNIYELDGELKYDNMSLVFSKQFILPTLGNSNYALFTNYEVERNKVIVVELVVPETNSLQFIAGYSLQTEIYPSYFASAECGFEEPTPISLVGQNLSLIMELNGTISNNITPTQIDGIERGGYFPVGTTTNTFSLPDGSTCTFDVTVEDVTVPNIICPDNVSLTLTGPVCDTFVFIDSPMAVDLCSGVELSNDFNNTGDASDIYSNGITPVVWTASDAEENRAICTMEVEIIGSLAADVSTENVSCPGGSDGSIDLIINSGSAPFNFQWSGNLSGQNPSDLSAGTYMLTVSDNSNCLFETIIEITEPAQFELSNLLITDATNGNENGNINIVITGGTPEYTYNWSNGETEPNVSNLGMGSYSCTITDANGCSFEVGPYEVDDVVPVQQVELFSALKVYPNPSSSLLTIEYVLVNENTLTIELFDLNGKALMQKVAEDSTGFETFSVAGLSQGIYLLRFVSDDKVYSRKVIVAK